MTIRIALIALGITACASAGEPVRSAWIMSGAGAASKLRQSPEVHSAVVNGESVVVRSAGLSLKYLGPLQESPVPPEHPREFVYEIPLHAAAATGRHSRVPADVIGVFVNGVPIHNQFEALSWNGSNIWHYDAIALKDDGSLTATGHPRAELTHPAPAGLLEELIASGSHHSPLIGFALDGFPVYGPWGYDGKRMRSSYRLRAIVRRRTLPDGTKLTPGQYGPDVDAANPLGTFVEDYEFVSGSGDLDEFNGRFVPTPEYPDGTYAYYLATDDAGKVAYPYLIGPRYFGLTSTPPEERWYPVRAKTRSRLFVSVAHPVAGRAVRFRLMARDSAGEPIRHFEYVHERPIHLVIVSDDLAEFAHIHPELQAGDVWEVPWTFARCGHYTIWADYALPGEAPHIDKFELSVDGPCEPITRMPSSGSLHVALESSESLRAGEDIHMTLRLSGKTETLEPYLGAWAHVIVVSQNRRTFAHVHPIESTGNGHTHSDPGPPPREIHVVTNFPTPGKYKLWVQFQQAGEVLTVPFVVQVAAAARVRKQEAFIPAGAIRISVSQHGYEPVQVAIPAGRPVTLAFTRDSTPTCASEVVFPSLDIRRALPPGQTVLVDLPAQRGGEIGFACGMGMFRGMVVAR